MHSSLTVKTNYIRSKLTNATTSLLFSIIALSLCHDPDACLERALHARLFCVAAIEIVIYFADKTGLDLMVDDGQHATAGELFEMVMEEMSFPEEARNIFSLWLVSELIGSYFPRP